jgi:hypothetical protein
VVTFQPDLEEVAEAAVGGHFGRGKVAVVVEDRFGGGPVVIEAARGFSLEKEIVVDEGHGETKERSDRYDIR